jgi:tetratricopeptide (TPR) repeat protein
MLAMLVAVGAGAAEGSNFYANLLRRGASDLAAGNYERALKELRIASFGLVDSLPEFQTAHVYMAIAARKLNRDADARSAVLRVVSAERIERHYASLPLAQEWRSAFDVIARKLLPADQVSFLYGTGPAPGPQPPRTIPAPVPSPTPAPVTVQPATPQPPPLPEPQPEPRPQPVVPAPAPTPKSTKPPVDRKPQPQPQPQPPAPAPAPQPVKPPPVAAPQTPKGPTAAEITRQLNAAEGALARNDLTAARVLYRQVLEATALDHDTAIRLSEGLYRARDFANALRAFGRAGALREGEEPYHYYKAVALYETGRYVEAKRELAAALPFIDQTPDVARYRAKIEGAIE